jgi:ferritin-like metal-binding protein YciE
MEQATETRDIFVDGLRNAHAMEKQALSVMQTQLNRLETYPELKAMLEQHYRETEQQIARLDEIFAELGESPSAVKDSILAAMGSMQAMSHAIASDEILKNTMADYMFEHFEVAAYTSLISMANLLGMASAVTRLEQNLAEEERCAALLLDALPGITEKFMLRTASGQPAGV